MSVTELPGERACTQDDGSASMDAMADHTLQRRDYATAVRLLIELLRTRPDDVRLLLNLGGALKELGEFDGAFEILTAAVRVAPDRHGAWSNLGTVCLELQRYDDAIATFSNALRLRPDHQPALTGLGVTFRRRGLPREALTFFDLALAAAPRDAELRTNRSLAILAAGDYQRGFVEYEWRLHTKVFADGLPSGPSWKGEPLRGRTLLLHGEGGLGDVIQFCRFVPSLLGMDVHLMMQVPPPLVRLLQRVFPIRVLSSEEAIPPYDLYCPLMSLPYALGMTEETIPSPGGYLSPDPAIVAKWQAVLAQDQTGRSADAPTPLKIGLVWSGGKRPWNLQNRLMDERRSMSLSDLAPLAACSDRAIFYSLQLGRPSEDLLHPPPGLTVIDHTASIGDFDDTSGLVSLLDLVIAVDTSTAHLAAALGRPVWLLSRFDQCWRWIVGRSDTPWYRTMDIFTQAAPFDWGGVVGRVAQRLRSPDPLSSC